MFRVISQNGDVDIPYETLCFAINYNYLNKREIIAYDMSSKLDTFLSIGTYRTMDDASDVLQMLRKAYINYLYPAVHRHSETKPEDIDKYHYDLHYFKMPLEIEMSDVK